MPARGETLLETAVCELDTEGRVRRWGAAAQRVFGMSEDDALGQILPMVPFDLRDDTVALLRDAASGAPCQEHTTVWCRADGTPVELSISLVQLSANGDGPGVACIVRDISERRLEQAQLQAYAKDVRESFGREL